MNLDWALQDMWADVRVAAKRIRLEPDLDDLLRVVPSASKAARPLVTCIVFSKDRGMQLDACLRSIERLAPYDGPIVVIYRATTEEFADGYEFVEQSERVRMVAESDDFRRDVMDAVDSAGEHTIFHTDDDVFFRRPAAPPLLPADIAAFSLRLGTNTTFCYPVQRPQPLPALSSKGPFIAWQWTRAKHDFSYPMSLDGHIFTTRMLVRMLRRARFANPNQLEEHLHRHRYLAPPAMAAFRESCLVSIPVNIVSETHRNRAGANPAWAPEELNRRFIGGQRIDLAAIDYAGVRGAHQELALAFKSTTPDR